MSTTNTNVARVYVACLASYVAGRLHGAWLAPADYGYDVDAFTDAARAAIRGEEWALHDREGFLSGMEPGEYSALDEACRFAELADDADDDTRAAIEAACDTFGVEYVLAGLQDDPDWVADRLLGIYDDAGDYAHDRYSTEVPEHLAGYIDWEAMERDMGPNGEASIVEYGGRHFVFAPL